MIGEGQCEGLRMLLCNRDYARLVIAIIATLGLVISLGALTTLYSQNTFAQNSNSGSANGGISGAYVSANVSAMGHILSSVRKSFMI